MQNFLLGAIIGALLFLCHEDHSKNPCKPLKTKCDNFDHSTGLPSLCKYKEKLKNENTSTR